MDAQTFLDNFSALTEAPGGTQRLRDLVLQLALQGRLATTDDTDGPVSALVEVIERDRETAIRGNGWRIGRSAGPISGDEIPWEVPSHWTWVRLDRLALPQAGFAFKSNQFNQAGRGTPLIRIRDIGNDHTECHFEGEYRDEFLVEEGDYLVGMDGNFNIRRWQGPAALLNQRVTRLIFFSDQVARPFVAWALQDRINALHGSRAYTTVQHLSGKQIAAAVIPLPPPREQERIVAKVDELMQLCNELESSQQRRHRAATRFRSSALHALSEAESTEDLHYAWDRVNDNWRAIVASTESVGELRQTILQLAFEGWIHGQSGTQTEGLPNSPSSRPTLRGPFPIPEHWGWARFDEVADSRLGKMLDKAKNAGPLRPYLRNANVQWFRFDLSDVQELRLEDDDLEPYSVRPGDLVICEGGEPGRLAVCDETVEGMVFQKALHRARPGPDIDIWYLAYLLRSYAGSGYLSTFFTGATIKHLTGKALSAVPVPVPPIEEQRQIVSGIESLLAACDNLEHAIVRRAASGAALAAGLTRVS